MYTGTIGIVGFGHLGYALYQSCNVKGVHILINNGSVERTIEKLQEKNIDISLARSLEELIKQCDCIFLCIKPAHLEVIAERLNKLLHEKHLIFSCLAMTPLKVISRKLQSNNPILVKIMPTLGIFNGRGMIAYQLPVFSTYWMKDQVLGVLQLLSANVYEMQTEKQMQLFTVYVACMPGILANFIHFFTWKIVQEEPHAFKWYISGVPQLLRSTADLIELAGSPSALWHQVATPGGVTEKMINILTTGGLSSLIAEAIHSGLEHMNGTKK